MIMYISIPICPESFRCAALPPFMYPFYNATDTSCGLIKVNCTPKPEEILIGGWPYVILERSDSGSSVLIYNKTFDQLLNNNTCEALMENFTSPSPLLYSFSTDPFITLFKCPNKLGYAQQVHTYFNQRNYNSYNGCEGYNFYYKYLVSNATVQKDLPSTCQVIQLPVKQRWQFYPQQPDEINISSLLSSAFTISFQMSASCEDCHRRFGQCDTNNGYFQCIHAVEGIYSVFSSSFFSLFGCAKTDS
ncbi:putative wall-associated receptor kinase [Helianthus annuus]|uniref:Wall-associated receptor kinase n=1 Tax=Helianthus annuus TaxID=4232 RepID=A0A9K3DHL9_HELAN|nr:putative wall-associated receptor kinase [Helianthus annuus]KAJ0429257.1 putative wall-associated receptor kinase [Helianthus annuus]KAJ0813282.1 putative wall-associated receptor kinase [Helianthus annuus]